jgi:ribosomal-protein-alanine N-acetyltransferase
MSFWWFWSQPPVIEEALDEDLLKVAEIHAASIQTCLGRRRACPYEGAIRNVHSVARRASPYGTQGPLGFLILRTAADEAEVITIAVHPRQRGRGIGKKLMEDGLFRLYGERCKSLFLEVDSSNEAAILLYRSLDSGKLAGEKGTTATVEETGQRLSCASILVRAL